MTFYFNSGHLALCCIKEVNESTVVCISYPMGFMLFPTLKKKWCTKNFQGEGDFFL